jgi:hypothetical protein
MAFTATVLEIPTAVAAAETRDEALFIAAGGVIVPAATALLTAA